MNTIDDEWQRLTENPDNVIMSESLRDMLDTSELAGEPPVERAVVVMCRVKYHEKLNGPDEKSISGTLMSFCAEGNVCILTIIASAEESLSMFPIQDIKSVDITNNVNDGVETLVVDEDAVVNVNVEFQYGLTTSMGASSAILTLTIPR